MKKIIYILAVIALAAGTFFAWKMQQDTPLPETLIAGNGRVEADEVDISSEYAGRITVLDFEEGDDVKDGAVMARLETARLEAMLDAARARAEKAEAAIAAADAVIAGRKSDLAFQVSELARAQKLTDREVTSKDRLEQAQTMKDTAEAALQQARAQLAVARAEARGADATVRELEIRLRDMVVRAPRNGRILYKLAERGEVLAPGGKVATLVDMDAVYMTIYVPEEKAGKIRIGDDARIVADALAETPFKASVSYVSDEAEFTPKEVQTTEERQKMVFRVKLRAADNADRLLKPGMPGTGYIKLDADAQWPENLE